MKKSSIFVFVMVFMIAPSVYADGNDDKTMLLIHSDFDFSANPPADPQEFIDSSLPIVPHTPHNIIAVGGVQHSADAAAFGASAIHFDGAGDYLEIPDSDDWTFDGDFTIDLWVRIGSRHTTVDGWVGQISDGNNLWYFGLHDTHGAQFALVSGGGPPIINIFQGAGTTASWATDVWYHVALVRNGTNFSIYRDGTLIAGGSDPDNIPDFYANLKIGINHYNNYIPATLMKSAYPKVLPDGQLVLFLLQNHMVSPL